MEPAPDSLSPILNETPYSLYEEAAAALSDEIAALDDRVALLRESGDLTEDTLRNYYGERRFEQVAESNAIEGSTLSVGETELAVLKGTTLTGHDPGYIRDARALDEALQELAEMAKVPDPTDIEQVRKLHDLIMGQRPSAGVFRSERVRISGSAHRPPKTRTEVIDAMEEWERWSRANTDAPAVVRATVLHAWLTHIHPFVDGNGRTARAVATLEFVRAGYPPPIIKKARDRDRYLEALQESDSGGDLRALLDLFMQRLDGAFVGLEQAARQSQRYDALAARVRRQQEQRLAVWNTSVQLFHNRLALQMQSRLNTVGGRATVKTFGDSLEFEDFVELCEGRPIHNSWAFRLDVEVPSLPRQSLLAWVGFRSDGMQQACGDIRGPALYWSVPNPAPEGLHPWVAAGARSPGFAEATIDLEAGDRWTIKEAGPAGRIVMVETSEAVTRVVETLLDDIAIA